MLMLGTLPWHDPRLYAAGVSEDESHWALLYSGQKGADSGRYSLLAMSPSEHVFAENFEQFEKVLKTNCHTFDHAWFGYLGYELLHSLESLPENSKSLSGIHFPRLSMSRFNLILQFDHDNETVLLFGTDESFKSSAPTPANILPKHQKKVDALVSNMNKKEYLGHVNTIKEALKRGDLYQANLTRKFYGTFSSAPHQFALFCDLSTISPAPYSAFLKYGDKAVISSSPERFLHVDSDRNANMHPIKGSAPRGKDEKEDSIIRKALAASEKDRAENLMIVDLCRNDLSRGCETGSVRVSKLFHIEKYATVYHMVSSIHGKKHQDISTLELAADCFPPGSMTGAPKIKAMELCNQLENVERGIYSGAIGWFGGDGSADLSVVIRTLLCDGNKFEFQVGGGIVLDSDPSAEWRETLIKARAIGKLLGISESQLEAL